MLLSVITALMSAVLLLTPPVAEAEQMRAVTATTVTFRLTLYGKAPEGELFTLNAMGGILAGGSPFCGSEFVPPACEGGGRVYTTIAGGMSAVPVTYTMTRASAGDAPGIEEEFVRIERAFASDATVSVYYVYDESGKPLGGGLGDGPGDGDKQDGRQTPEPEPTTDPTASTPEPTATVNGMPEIVPELGAGGSDGPSVPPGVIALALGLPLLAACRYLTLKRR